VKKISKFFGVGIGARKSKFPESDFGGKKLDSAAPYPYALQYLICDL
jgi:hypothetical protein